MTSKERYHQYYKSQSKIPVFLSPAWLDAATEGNWDVKLTYNNCDEIVGIMPLCKKRKLGISAIYTPLLTPFCGIWIDERSIKSEKNAKYHSRKRQIIQDLCDQIDNVSYYRVNFHYCFDNWYPFYKNNFRQTTNYTHLLKDIKNLDKIWNGLKSNVRNKIKLAGSNYKVIESEDLVPLVNLTNLNFKSQNIKMPFDLKYLQSLDGVVRNQRKIFYAINKEGIICGGQYTIVDHESAYNLILSISEEHKKHGIAPLLIYHSIKYASSYVDIYDFEGSMIPGVQTFFESFGGSPTPYFQIYRIQNPIMRMWFSLINKI